MWLVFILLIATMLFSAPVHVQADAHHSDQTLLRIRLSIGGITKQWRLKVVRTPAGHQLIAAGRDGRPRPLSPQSLQGSPAEKLLGKLRGAHAARRFLLRHVHLDRLDASIRLHSESAARTALATGFLRMLPALLPPAWRCRSRIRITPEFLHAHSILQARCILHFRLGTIIITAGMLLASIASQRALKPREAAIYGTSHR